MRPVPTALAASIQITATAACSAGDTGRGEHAGQPGRHGGEDGGGIGVGTADGERDGAQEGHRERDHRGGDQRDVQAGGHEGLEGRSAEDQRGIADGVAEGDEGGHAARGQVGDEPGQARPGRPQREGHAPMGCLAREAAR